MVSPHNPHISGGVMDPTTTNAITPGRLQWICRGRGQDGAAQLPQGLVRGARGHVLANARGAADLPVGRPAMVDG